MTMYLVSKTDMFASAISHAGISSLSSYALISLGRDRRALTASYQYLVMGTIGATFILIGIGLLYMLTGTLNMHDLSERLSAVGQSHGRPACRVDLTTG